MRDISNGCNILCGTPGRLLDMIGRAKVKLIQIFQFFCLQLKSQTCKCSMSVLQVGLEKVRYLVMDEADRMLDMGFEPDMRRLVGSPGMPTKENRQTLMFSATYPEDIQRSGSQSAAAFTALLDLYVSWIVGLHL